MEGLIVVGRDPLEKSIRRVAANGNCSGCGACVLVSPRVSMGLDEEGYMRPRLNSVFPSDGLSSAEESKLFKAICPGVGLAARAATEMRHHEIFGAFVSSWQGWASDPDIRFSGSSGGVITALAAWLLETGRATSVVGSRGGETDPKRTVTVSVEDTVGVKSISGSRYAPVSNAELYKADDSRQVFVGKPCEASAAAKLSEAAGVQDPPILLSFFCAGTPSQLGTDNLVRLLGHANDVDDVRYRGNGWPGEFRLSKNGQRVGSMSYDESWGRHIGRQIQWRCKICPDGTGGDADISVGDFWAADANGYPVFDTAEGNSVVIARSQRGAVILREAAAAGIIALAPVDLDDVAAIQPLQVERKITLLGRLVGRIVTLKRVPRYRGFGLAVLSTKGVKKSTRAVVGTARRSVRWMQ
ncbi:Coenzyme F420 hydrogenase/dehydrogenase, beta subunit C-terminal domain [Rhodococcus qingshengii]|nr:Coenzyme F420 hydrogenase/dehydrogenase, beta subunit C-terminal domain [Rhodococcus qingshengii]